MKIDEIKTLISTTIEPRLNLSVEELGIIPKVFIENSIVNINLEIGFPFEPIKESLIHALKTTLYTKIDNHTFNISLHQEIQIHRTQLIGKGLRNVKNIIAVASGKGGVGKSTIALNLAISLAKASAKVGILDADIYGPSIPLMLGKTNPIEIYNDKYVPANVHGIQAMSIGYLTESGSALIWRGPMLAKSLIQMLDSTNWDDLDYLFIDLPPGTGDIQLSLVQKIPIAGAIIVTTPQQVATLDADKSIQMFEKTGIYNIGIIENMSSHVCSNCGHADTIFGEGGAKALAETFNCNFLGEIPLDKNIGIDCDAGKPTSIQNNSKISDIFMDAALKSAITLSKRPLNYADKFPPIIAESNQV